MEQTTVYVVDSAGYLLPDQVTERIHALKRIFRR